MNTGSSRLSREQLLSCLEFGKALTSELDPTRLLKRIMEKISRLFPSETWSLLLLDEATQTLRFELSIDLDLEQMKDVRLALGQSAAGRCALKQELLVLEDVRHGIVEGLERTPAAMEEVVAAGMQLAPGRHARH